MNPLQGWAKGEPAGAFPASRRATATDRAAALIEAVLTTCGAGPVGILGGASHELTNAAVDRGLATVSIDASPTDRGHPRCRTVVAHVANAHPMLPARWLHSIAETGCRFACLVLPFSTSSHEREAWLAAGIASGWRRHALDQSITPYDVLDALPLDGLLLLERVSPDAERSFSLGQLQQTRDLHMDMLREAGRRADAHVARYTFARQFVRAGDRVLDAACGLGYGAAILHDGTLCANVEGLDVDTWAIDYAQAHYAASRPRVRYTAADVTTLGTRAEGTVDSVVSFETLEHLARPEAFVQQVARILTPGGRFICSVPCLWVDEHGRDPNPFHLGVFDRARLLALLQPHFVVEHLYAQTAGGGMKLPLAGRAFHLDDGALTDAAAEWWVAVAMLPVETQRDVPYRDGFLRDDQPRATSPLLDFASGYRNPWLVRALVSIGVRTHALDVLDEMTARVLATADAESADAGAALCVRAYRQLASGLLSDPDSLLGAIDLYVDGSSNGPHVLRWQASLTYVSALLALAAGDASGAQVRFRRCACMDASAFSVLLDTKIVGAALLAGWLALQAGTHDEARELWALGLRRAEEDVRRPWEALLVDPARPPLFALRELALVVELASQCASGLHLLEDADARPGAVASELWNTSASRYAAAERRGRMLGSYADYWRQGRDRYLDVARQVPALAIVQAVPLLTRHMVAIFGSGAGGRAALHHVRACGHDVVTFLDNDVRRWGTCIESIPVAAPAALGASGASIVIIASEPGEAAIRAQLRELGLRDAVHFASIFERTHT